MGLQPLLSLSLWQAPLQLEPQFSQFAAQPSTLQPLPMQQPSIMPATAIAATAAAPADAAVRQPSRMAALAALHGEDGTADEEKRKKERCAADTLHGVATNAGRRCGPTLLEMGKECWLGTETKAVNGT